jgi:Kef-type K+ transport system membrane component KefB
MVVAQIGLGFGVMAQNIYGTIVFMSIATTLVAPPLLRFAFRHAARPGIQKQEALHIG